MDLEIYIKICYLCKIEFEKRYGTEHDKYVWCSQAFDYLVNNVLDIKRFVYKDKTLEWMDKGGSRHVFVNVDDTCIRHFVYRATYDVLEPIYQRIMQSNDPSISKRVAKLDAICDKSFKRECDVLYMSEFVELVLRKGSLTDSDCEMYGKFLKNHIASTEKTQLLGGIAEMMLSCTIS